MTKIATLQHKVSKYKTSAYNKCENCQENNKQNT